MIVILPTCPKCGCHDIRAEWGYMCFKCGYQFPDEEDSYAWTGKSEDIRKH